MNFTYFLQKIFFYLLLPDRRFLTRVMKFGLYIMNVYKNY